MKQLEFSWLARLLSKSLMLASLALSSCGSLPTEVPPSPTSPPALPTSTRPIPTAGPTLQASRTPTPIPVETSSSLSPDGEWTAKVTMVGPYEEGGEQLYRIHFEVVSMDGTVEWVVRDETLSYGLGYTWPDVVEWSSDGRYLYFTDQYSPDGCALFVNGFNLFRLNLANGEIIQIVPDGARWVSISPDERIAVSVAWTGEETEIVKVEIGQDREMRATFDPEYTQAGAIVWSPDGRKLALTLAKQPCEPGAWTQAIAILELGTMSKEILYESTDPLLTTESWPTQGTIELLDDSGGPWKLSVATGEVQRAAE